MQKITLEINNSIYDNIMFFLENLPKNLVTIKKESQPINDNSSSPSKELPSGFLKPIQIDSYKKIATRDELYER
jgi:hypothetical protein